MAILDAIFERMRQSGDVAVGGFTIEDALGREWISPEVASVAFFGAAHDAGMDLAELRVKILDQLSERLAHQEIDPKQYTLVRRWVEETFEKTIQGGALHQRDRPDEPSERPL